MIKKVLLLVSFFFVCQANATEFASAQDIQTQFKKYTLADVKTDEAIVNVISEIESAVQFCVTHPVRIEVTHEIMRVAALTTVNDPTVAVAEVLVPFYQKKPADFERALKSIPYGDARLLRATVKASIHEKSEGNG